MIARSAPTLTSASLSGLSREDAFADDIAGAVDRNLASDIDGPTAADFHDMTRLRRELLSSRDGENVGN